MNEFKDKNIHVVGLGVEGAALADYFLSQSARVTVHHKAEPENLEQDSDLNKFKEKGAKFRLGKDYLQGIEKANFVGIIQSAFSYLHRESNQRLYDLYQRNPEIFYTDLKIFFAECPATIVGVTGSKGKTTTTDLLGKIVSTERRAWALGNIGKSPLTLVDELSAEDVAILEISNYQLEYLKQSPHIAVLLNITPDHLVDYGGDFEKYQKAKQRIVKFQKPEDFKIINLDDLGARSAMEIGEGTLFGYSLELISEGVFVENGEVKIARKGELKEVISVDQLPFPGRHNVSNFLAATAAACLLGVSVDNIRKVAWEYELLPHRLEEVKIVKGVKFVNDSKATTPAATKAALKSFPAGKIILIAGGKNKGLPVEELGKVIDARVKKLILLGETADKLANSVSTVSVAKVNSLEEAVAQAYSAAEQEDVVLLSPAAASFDMFKNYKDRGNKFKEIVNKL